MADMKELERTLKQRIKRLDRNAERKRNERALENEKTPISPTPIDEKANK
jgi:hypothetical protein